MTPMFGTTLGGCHKKNCAWGGFCLKKKAFGDRTPTCWRAAVNDPPLPKSTELLGGTGSSVSKKSSGGGNGEWLH